MFAWILFIGGAQNVTATEHGEIYALLGFSALPNGIPLLRNAREGFPHSQKLPNARAYGSGNGKRSKRGDKRTNGPNFFHIVMESWPTPGESVIDADLPQRREQTRGNKLNFMAAPGMTTNERQVHVFREEH